MTKHYKIPVTQQVEISFDAAGDDNYSKIVNDPITFPTNITAYAPFLIQAGSDGLAINSTVPVGAVGSAITGVPVRGTYGSYYSCNLNNAEFMYQNSTILPSWLEGNITNEDTANTLCTSSSSPSALVNSGNVLYLVENDIKLPFIAKCTTNRLSYMDRNR